MLWFGRLISLPLSIVFFGLMLVNLLLIQFTNSFLDPEFYLSEMRRADTYKFALGELLTTFIDEARANPPDRYPSNIDGNLFVTTEQVISSTRKVVPPELVQELVEQSFGEIGKYLSGEQANFVVTYKSGEQAAALVDEIKSLIHILDTYNLLFEKVITPRVNDAVALDLPLGITLSNDRVIKSIQTIAPPNWVHQQIESSLDAATPYFLGVTDSFEIRINLEDRVEIAIDEAKGLLKKSDAYELLYAEIIASSLASSLGDDVELPFDLTVTGKELLDGLRRTAPSEWIQIQVERTIDDAAPYLVGKTDRFSTLISLDDNKREAEAIITELVNIHLTETLRRRPSCRRDQIVDAQAAARRGELPHCLPRSISVDQLLSEAGIDPSEWVRNIILPSVPNEIRFTDTHLRLSLNTASGEKNIDRMDEVRQIFKDGLIYTDKDLKKYIFKEFGQEGLDILEDVRGFLRNGVSYSSQDLQSFKPLFGQRPSEDAVRILNHARDSFELWRTYRWVLWVSMSLVLIIIGFLSSRSCSGRIVYASVPLVIASGAILVVSGPLYDNIGKQQIEERRVDILTEFVGGVEFPQTAHLAATKLFDMGISVADRFTSGIFGKARNLFVIGLLLLGAGIFWTSVKESVNRIRRLVYGT